MPYQIKTQLAIRFSPVILAAVLALALMQSCGKADATSPSASNTKLLIVNASPDTPPFSVFVNNVQMGISTFKYGIPSAYYAVGSGSQLIRTQIAYNSIASAVYLSQTDSLINNANYTLYVTGLTAATLSADSLTYVLTPDTSSTPALGRAKIKFVNVSPRSAGFDVSANGTPAFSNVPYKAYTSYIAVPVGIYTFNITAHNAPSNSLTQVQASLLDGKLYTLYTHGITGRTDSAALAAGVITNR